jgi:hypothetical protein
MFNLINLLKALQHSVLTEKMASGHSVSLSLLQYQRAGRLLQQLFFVVRSFMVAFVQKRLYLNITQPSMNSSDRFS